MYNSVITSENRFNTTYALINWIHSRNKEVSGNIQQILFSEMDEWHQDKDGCLRHTSGKLFSIQVIHVETNLGSVLSWD